MYFPWHWWLHRSYFSLLTERSLGGFGQFSWLHGLCRLARSVVSHALLRLVLSISWRTVLYSLVSSAARSGSPTGTPGCLIPGDGSSV